MGYSVPAPEVVAIEELKAFLRVESEIEDGLLHELLRAAAATVEGWIGQVLIRRDVVERKGVVDGHLRLAHAPVVSVHSVSVETSEGTLVPLEPADWALLPAPGDAGWLRVRASGAEIARVEYRAGISEDWNGVPEPLRLTVLRCAAHGFATRDSPDAPAFPAIAR